ncbi:Bug family tripartite tricarboxylate transporter substrate binding protein [Variovorax ginsengisoli]|uniref:Tripartite tricarboxylate transporter substrate binding protein n=1 Tax=Variovorax ginsengisoli TaxID=363844 RepID=A0ABT8SEV0_9BURK|nr:tripartite tricarboxylate transporter substrate binding protein [Variovorax ginsengisoli]MDN8618278.1 tripartite tricarboxylate transporter substrate binding protein [Variovorax ginsengisoli]MDO1537448.1 tripartite tricarboxylate transporter substrate binding protein [Variovorax ginsengisoli]
MKFLHQLALSVVLCATGVSTMAQSAAPEYPTRAITFVVPYSPGGGADVIARAVAKTLSESLRQPVVIDNKPGGAGQIAAAFVAKAPPDGYTLLLNADSIYTINPALKGKPAEDALANLSPVANIVGAPVVVAVSASNRMQAKTLKDLITFAKQSKTPLSYASPGIGTPHQLIAEALGKATGITWTHVPYKGTANAMTDLIGGQVDVLFGMPSSVTPMAEAGKLRILALTSFESFPLLPGTPTVAQTYPKVGMATVDMGLAVPRGTPVAIVRRLHDEVQRSLADPGVQKVIQQNGMVALPGSTDEYIKRMRVARSEREVMIREAGVTSD